MRNRRDDQWESIPTWAFDIIELQLMILAKLTKRDSKLSPADQAKVDSIAAVVADINKKIDAAQET
jgi:hypothetical protein